MPKEAILTYHTPQNREIFAWTIAWLGNGISASEKFGELRNKRSVQQNSDLE